MSDSRTTDENGIIKEVTAGTFRTSLGSGWLPFEALTPYTSQSTQKTANLLSFHSFTGGGHGRAKDDEADGHPTKGSAVWHGPWQQDSSRQRTADSTSTVVAHLNPLKQWRKRFVKAAAVAPSRSPQGDIFKADFEDKKFDPVYPARWRQAMQGDAGNDAETKGPFKRHLSTHIIEGSERLNTANDGEFKWLTGWSS